MSANTDTPLALRLADWQDDCRLNPCPMSRQVAAELRRIPELERERDELAQCLLQMQGAAQALAQDGDEARAERDAAQAAAKHESDLAQQALDSLRAMTVERDELQAWKAEALAVMPDFQAIGQALGVPLGEAVHDRILPGILALQAQLKAAQEAKPAPEESPSRADLIAGLTFYAQRDHMILSDESAWGTVSGEPQNWWCDEAETATVEDGSIAAEVLAGRFPAYLMQFVGEAVDAVRTEIDAAMGGKEQAS